MTPSLRTVPVMFLAVATLVSCDGQSAPSNADGGSGGTDGAGGTGGIGGIGGTGGATEGPFSLPVELAGPELGSIQGAPALAVDGSGNGLALIVADDGLWAVRLPGAGGAPEAPVRVDANGVAAGQVRLGLAADGDGFAFWLGAAGGIEGAAYAAGTGFGPAEGYLGTLDRLALSALDVDPEGDAVVGFAYYDATNDLWQLGHAILDAARDWRPAEGWAIQRVAKTDLAIVRADPYLSVVGAWVNHLGRAWASAIDLDRASGQLTQTSGTPLDLGAEGDDEDLQVAFDGAGDAHVVWRRVAADGEHIEVQRRYSDQRWSTPVALGQAAPGNAPVLAAPRDGAGAAVAFVDETGALQVARLDGTEWRTDRVHATSAVVGEVSLAFSPDGGLHVAFVEGSALRVAAWLPGADGWEAPFPLDDGDASAPVLRAGGESVYVIWVRTAPGGEKAVVGARR